jgi:hypothetical protein
MNLFGEFAVGSGPANWTEVRRIRPNESAILHMADSGPLAVLALPRPSRPPAGRPTGPGAHHESYGSHEQVLPQIQCSSTASGKLCASGKVRPGAGGGLGTRRRRSVRARPCGPPPARTPGPRPGDPSSDSESVTGKAGGNILNWAGGRCQFHCRHWKAE